MFLFLISVLLVFLSAYGLTAIFLNKRHQNLSLIYIPLIMFANIVLSFEILSLFKAITITNVLILNILSTITTVIFWIKKNKPIIKINIKRFLKTIWLALLKDKTLFILTFAWLCFIGITTFLVTIIATTNPDGELYHVLRSFFYIENKSLSHFSLAEARAIVFPFNSEILYAWLILFTKKLEFIGAFSFLAYFVSISALYNILTLIRLPMVKKLWVIFLVSSFANVIVQISGTETDIIISALVLSSIALFWIGVKTEQNTHLFISALAFALAVGVKTTAIFSIPACAIYYLLIAKLEEKINFKKYFITFFKFATLNFLIFSSYNYIQNLVEFGNPMGCYSITELHKNQFGLKGAIANFINNFFLLIDFSGLKPSTIVTEKIIEIKKSIFTTLNLSNYVTTNAWFREGLRYKINYTLIEPLMGAGVLGFLIFLPCTFFALIKLLFDRSKKSIILAMHSGYFYIAMITLSICMMYIVFNVRFLSTFLMVASSILAYSYFSNKNPLKYLIIGIACFYLIGVSSHLWSRPFTKIVKSLFNKTSTYSQVHDLNNCYNTYYKYNTVNKGLCDVEIKIRNDYKKKNKVMIFSNEAEEILTLKAMTLDGYDINFGLLKEITPKNLCEYNIFLYPKSGQRANFIRDNHQNPYAKCYYGNVQGDFIDLSNKSLVEKCFLSQKFLTEQGFTINGEINHFFIFENIKKPPLKNLKN